MTSPKLVTNPPEGSGLVPSLVLDALREWAQGENVTQDQLNEQMVAHFGGPEFAATDDVEKASLAHLLEFAGHVGAIDDPYADGTPDPVPAPGFTDAEPDDDAAGAT